ncbi:MAG: hypothetical protein JW702_07960 [Clostridiales bacterium]|nr:hypothetical protein [Clostridiales bacterium]
MTEQKTTWTEAIVSVRKLNPLVFIISFVLTMNCLFTLQGESSFQTKILVLFFTGFFVLLISFFEVYRVQKQEEQQEKILSTFFKVEIYIKKQKLI